MRHNYIYIIGIILCLASCTPHTKHWETLMQVESFIEERPDSALTVLQGMDKKALSGKEEEAKHALLLSMALDKNVIDRTDFEVLQPAIDYYENHGTANEKLRTYYYQGRIYQNKNERDSSMQAFIKARELEAEMTDTFTFANLLVAQGTYHYSTYKYEEFIANNLQAAPLYQAIGRSHYQMRCLANALDGSIVKKNKPLADSILTCCQNLVKEYPDYGSYMIPYMLTYTITWGSDEEIRTVIDLYQDNNELSNVARLNIALGYIRIGKAKKALEMLETVRNDNSLKYYTIKLNALEENHQYKEALDAFRSYYGKLEEKHLELFSHDLLFAQKKHELEMTSLQEIQKREKITWYSICGAFILLIVIGWIYYRYRTSQAQRIIAEQENTRLRLEQENLGMRISQLESESENLKNLLSTQNDLSAPVAEAIKVRIEMLNGLLAAQITDNESYAKPYDVWIDEVLKDKDAFMDSTRLAFKASHPHFINHLEEHGLTEWEINYCCLYAMGLKGREVGTYIKMRSHYNVSSDIREKLGINEHDTNLGIYLRKLLAHS